MSAPDCFRTITSPVGRFTFHYETRNCWYTPHDRSPEWSAPLYAQIALTERCSANCAYCYARDPEGAGAEWDFGTLEATLGVLEAWGTFGVAYGGGDPLEYAHLEEALAAARKRRLATSVTVNSAIVASMPSKIAALRKAARIADEIRLSVNSVMHVPSFAMCKKETAPKMRTGRSRRGAPETPFVGANVLVTRGLDVEALALALYEAGCRDYLFNAFAPAGAGRRVPWLEPDKETLLAAGAAIAALLKAKCAVKVSGRFARKLAEAGAGEAELVIPLADQAGAGSIVAIDARMRVGLSSLADASEKIEVKSPEKIPGAWKALVARACGRSSPT